MRLEDRVIVITGAGRGLAAKTAKLLGSEGAIVVAGDKNGIALATTVEEIRSKGRTAEGYEIDITSAVDAERIVRSAVDKFGRVDGLINCAGGYHVYEGLLNTTEDNWDSVVDTNLKGTFLMCKAVLPFMIERSYGRIVNISSLAARSYSYFLGAHYAAAKAGVLGLTRHIAHEFGPNGICANAIAPTAFKGERLGELMSNEQEQALTASIPLRRIPSAEDIAPVIAFLISDESRFISGATVDVNGAQVTA